MSTAVVSAKTIVQRENQESSPRAHATAPTEWRSMGRPNRQKHIFFDFIIIAWQSEGAINQSIASVLHTSRRQESNFFYKIQKYGFCINSQFLIGQKNIGKTQILHKLCIILLIELWLGGKILPKILPKVLPELLPKLARNHALPLLFSFCQGLLNFHIQHER